MEEINPILRGWMPYFRIGHSSRCFSKIRDWVEMKIRRHLMRSRLRKGKGWKPWSSEWIYRRLGLYNDNSSRPTLGLPHPIKSASWKAESHPHLGPAVLSLPALPIPSP